MEKNFATILKELRTSRGVSQSDLAIALGVSKSTISMYECNRREPNFETLEAIADYFNVNMSTFFGDKATPSLPKNFFPLPSEREYPFLGKIACGKPILAEENVSDHLTLPEVKGADFVMQCKGDSMIDARINDGDIVFIRAQDTVENGEIAAVAIDGEITLKRVYVSGGVVQLMPANSKYPPLVYTKDNCDCFRIVGKALKFLSNVL